MTRSLLKRWRKSKQDDVPVRLPFSDIMEFATGLRRALRLPRGHMLLVVAI